MATKRIRTQKGGRLHLRVDSDVIAQMHDYAKRHHTDVTSIVTRHFLELLAADAVPLVPEAEQI